MLLLRVLSRLMGALFMLFLALLGLGLALYCLDGLVGLGSARPDRVLDLPTVRDSVGHWLAQLAAPGSTAGLALLCGVLAMLLGVLLLVGTLRSSRQRLAVMRAGYEGTVAARPRVLRAIARTLAQRADGATSVGRPRLALSRRGNGGRLRVTATQSPGSDRQAVERAIVETLEPVSEPFHLRPRVHVSVGERGARAQ